MFAVLQNINDSMSEEEDGDESDLRPQSRVKIDRWAKLMDKVKAIRNDDIKSSTRDSKTNFPLRLQRII